MAFSCIAIIEIALKRVIGKFEIIYLAFKYNYAKIIHFTQYFMYLCECKLTNNMNTLFISVCKRYNRLVSLSITKCNCLFEYSTDAFRLHPKMDHKSHIFSNLNSSTLIGGND